MHVHALLAMRLCSICRLYWDIYASRPHLLGVSFHSSLTRLGIHIHVSLSSHSLTDRVLPEARFTIIPPVMEPYEKKTASRSVRAYLESSIF